MSFLYNIILILVVLFSPIIIMTGRMPPLEKSVILVVLFYAVIFPFFWIYVLVRWLIFYIVKTEQASNALDEDKFAVLFFASPLIFWLFCSTSIPFFEDMLTRGIPDIMNFLYMIPIVMLVSGFNLGLLACFFGLYSINKDIKL